MINHAISHINPWFVFQYPNGKIWPLIISKNETHNQNDAQFRNRDDEWKTDQQKIVNLIEGNQNSTDSSSKGGTYNPRIAWETIDRGRSSSITHTKNILTYNLEIQGNETKIRYLSFITLDQRFYRCLSFKESMWLLKCSLFLEDDVR